MGKYKRIYKSLANIKSTEPDVTLLTKKLFIAFADELREMADELVSENLEIGSIRHDGQDGHIELIYKDETILSYFSKYDNHKVLVTFGKHKKKLHSEAYSIDQFTKHIQNDEIVGFDVEKVTKQHFAEIFKKINTH